jgi:ABC-type multidrug transport system fused ATPase/permease subunit
MLFRPSGSGESIGSPLCMQFLTMIRFWASQYEGHPSGEVNVVYYLTVYGALLLIGTIVYSGAYLVFLFGSIAASRKIHERLMSSILAANLRFLDQTPVGRIISRFTLDIRAVDGPVSSMLADFSQCITTCIFHVLMSFQPSSRLP